MSQAPITLIGSGLAAYTLARELRKKLPDAPLRILSRDSADFYSKPLLSNAITSGKTAAQLIGKTALHMAEELNADILPYTAVERIDPASQTLHTARGSFAYQSLVLALGADPYNPGLAGDAADHVLQVNDLADYARFREQLAGSKRIAIIGAGLIGCEFANDLLASGIEVHLIDPAAHPLSRLLPPEAGAWLAAKLAAGGVHLHLNDQALSLHQADPASGAHRYHLFLKSGEVLPVDSVLSAIGLAPRVHLAQQAGLRVNRGIVVDDFLRTQDAHIYALGDCAEIGGRVLPFVMPLMHSARALAATLSGQPTPVVYPVMPVMVKTPCCPTVASPALPGATGQWHLTQTDTGLHARFEQAGRLFGFALLGTATSSRQSFATEQTAALADAPTP